MSHGREPLPVLLLLVVMAAATGAVAALLLFRPGSAGGGDPREAVAGARAAGLRAIEAVPPIPGVPDLVRDARRRLAAPGEAEEPGGTDEGGAGRRPSRAEIYRAWRAAARSAADGPGDADEEAAPADATAPPRDRRFGDAPDRRRRGRVAFVIHIDPPAGGARPARGSLYARDLESGEHGQVGAAWLDDEGRVAFALPRGRHELALLAPGFAAAALGVVDVPETGAGPLHRHVVLARAARVAGRVTRAGGPALGAEVAAYLPSAAPGEPPWLRLATEFADAAGRYSLDGLPPETVLNAEGIALDLRSLLPEIERPVDIAIP